jgi:tricorn protease
MRTRLLLLAAGLLLPLQAVAREPIFLANNPALSPDGATLAFDYNGDIWTVPTAGGTARQLTQNPGRDRQPRFSPDGKEIAFVSDRDGSPQVYVMPAQGGSPRQLTHHTAGYTLEEWSPDGKSLLVSGQRDHFWRHAERFFQVDAKEAGAEKPLFDDYGASGALSPDGKRLLFTREGMEWWRKGYRGSRAAQVWLCELGNEKFTKVVGHETGGRWPLWKPDGKGFYFVGAQKGSDNLWEHDLDSGKERQLTHFKDDAVVFPCISRDGSTIVFRRLFDLYRFQPGKDEKPHKIDIFDDGDHVAEKKDRRVLTTATQVAFSSDGLEVAFIAGGDLWVMDTELREPRQITSTSEEERFPIFSPDGDSILFVSDKGGQCDIWKAERADKQKYWFLNHSFKLSRITNDAEVESNLRWSPDGSKVAYLKNRGDLWVMDADGKNPKRVLEGFSAPEFDWSPDGKWFVVAREDNDFNRDVWIVAVDGSREPFNLSRHPFNEHLPVWSPDGKLIAFTGKRTGENNDIYFVWLREEEEKDTRDRLLDKALDKINKIRKPGPRRTDPEPGPKDLDLLLPFLLWADETPPKKPNVPAVAIDFDRLHERIRPVRLAEGSNITSLFWSPDSKKLAFTGTVEGKRGTYTIDIPEDLKPKQLSTIAGTQARWLKQGNQIVWLANGVPSSLPTSPVGRTTPAVANPNTPPAPTTPGPRRGGGAGAATPSDPDASGGGGTSYRFSAQQEVDVPKKHAAAFELAWRTMRDNWYDERLGNRDWKAVRSKYLDHAGKTTDSESLATIVNLMLGELNGSHLGFVSLRDPAAARFLDPPAPGAEPPSRTWNVTTAHLGVRFDPKFAGPGLKVRDVLPGGPADQKKSRLNPGDVITKIDGVVVDPKMDLTRVLNGPIARDIVLTVQGEKEREVVIRPITYTAARTLLYEKWLRDNRKMVEELSNNKYGYLHISAMNMPSFYKFEEELYAVGAGKEGLVIDVRENGGGSTTDHLLTALTQPVHAITVPRGGIPGYPHDRKVYATWNKPIVVLCNQNSFSNAEIFSHAIKTLKRGQLVGVPTAGGVISTGGTQIMDVGFLRLPTRGWYLVDSGEDMELHGAAPHHLVWPEPGQMPRGKDVQIAKAVAVLREDVTAWQQRPQPKLKKATERPVEEIKGDER